MTRHALMDVIETTRVILLDFDGPVCSVFAERTWEDTADRLLQEVKLSRMDALFDALSTSSQDDPLNMLKNMMNLPGDVHRRIEQIIQNAEMRAVESAIPTPGIDQFLSACKGHGLPVVIVTNNSVGAVTRYLDRCGVQGFITAVFARDLDDPSLMKPNPHLVRRAIEYSGLPAGQCTLVGDSTTDITAARSARARSIGYANKPGKLARLTAAGADATITAMNDLTQAIIRATDVPSPSRIG